MPNITKLFPRIIDKTTSKNDLLSILLRNRGLKANEIDEFFKPTHPKILKTLDFGIKPIDLTKTVAVIKKAIVQNKQILIYGDYDVDGLTSTTLMWQALTALGAKVMPFIPHRQRDGYGFKLTSLIAFEAEKKLHFDLIITVDNGIVATKDLKVLLKQGRTVVVIDHHLPDGPLPKKITVVHTPITSGSVLSWLVAKELNPAADLGLAALGAVADCVSLVGINRNIVVHGLKELRLNPNPGIRKLIEISRCHQDTLSAYDLGFLIGPRINAVGRLSDPTDALRLLCSPNSTQAAKYAQILDSSNQDRQTIQADHLEEAEKLVKNNKNKVIIIASKVFNPGIIGLIASRLVEKYYLPTIVISIDGDIAKGSCRSIPDVNIIKELRLFSSLFIDLGGHAGAAGFSITTKNIPKLTKKITTELNRSLKDVNLQPSIAVDAQMLLAAATLHNAELIQKLEPFGVGNAKPLFLFERLCISSKKVLGANGDHLKLVFANPITNAIAFKKGDLDETLKVGDYVDVVASLDINEWQGSKSPQLIIKEITSVKISHE